MSWRLRAPDENRATTMSHENDVYTFHVRLVRTENPTISRLICVPASLTFDCFHLILQTAFGWSNKHRYSFTVSEPRPPNQYNSHPNIANDLLTIDEAEDAWPERSSDADADALTGGARASATERTLSSVLADPRLPAAEKTVLLYHYDFSFGDGWSHEVIFLGRSGSEQQDAAKRALGRGVVEGQAAWCVSGEGHACAEDCGGPDAWRRLKDAFAQKPYFNVDDGSGTSPFDLRLWFAAECSNAEGEVVLDPWEWDITKVNQQLAGLTALSEGPPDPDE